MKVLFLAGVVLFASSLGWAATVACPTNTLDYYVANFTTADSGCTIGDKVFYGFADALNGTGVTINVSPIDTAFDPGLSYTLIGFSVGSGSSMDLKLGFNVATISGADNIEDVSLGIGGAQFSGTGLVSVGENVCVGAAFVNVGAGTNCPSGNSPPNEIALNVQNPGPPPVFFDMKMNTLTNLVGVFKDVSVVGGTEGSASLSSFTQQFSEVVPEPVSILLLGTCLLLIGPVLRRRLTRDS